jgi:hypothetical protein
MIRTQIQLSEEQLQALREAAAADHASMAQLIRQAIDGWLSARGEIDSAERRRRAAEAPSFRTGLANLAEEHDHYLATSEDES